MSRWSLPRATKTSRSTAARKNPKMMTTFSNFPEISPQFLSKFRRNKGRWKYNTSAESPRTTLFSSESSTRLPPRRTEGKGKKFSIDTKKINLLSIKLRKARGLTTFSIFLIPSSTRKIRGPLDFAEFSISAQVEMKTDLSSKESPSAQEPPQQKRED